ncbi:hypothetical protein [uncultured Polaribacter sp.]|uniref:HYC_CC_PP family protein n=1 Tax=uncultured Polaribacter sp. TaxID=174711 RepID=UPI002612A19E|nr:hypothetical protein [uncultured Polaribacter sp.]
MKKNLNKITSTFLAFLVLCSTFSFTVKSHYCGAFLMDISFIGDADGCGMEMEQKATAKKKSCCKDEIHTIEGQDELQSASELKFDFKKQQFLTSFLISYQLLLSKQTTQHTYYKDFSPPDTPKDYQVLFQSFLI